MNGIMSKQIIAFLEGEDLTDAIRNAVSLGGDSDTIACITGAVGEAFWGFHSGEVIARDIDRRLPDGMIAVLERFTEYRKKD